MNYWTVAEINVQVRQENPMPRYDMYVDVEGVNDVVLTPTGDFRFTETLQESLAQRLSLRYTTWLGEWSFNLDFGTPYRQRILSGALRTKQELDAEFRRIALLETDVTSVGEIISELNPETRKYDIKRIDVYVNNQSLTVPLSDPNKRTNSYPEPLSFEDFVLCELTPDEIQAINDLDNLINVDMQEGGDATWWNSWYGGKDPRPATP